MVGESREVGEAGDALMSQGPGDPAAGTPAPDPDHRDPGPGAAVRGGPDHVRLRVVEAAEGLAEGELLRLALQQAVAALGGYGGLAHLVGEEGGTLRLAAVNGLPPALARRWDTLSVRTATAPALAVTNAAVSWSSRWPVPEPEQPAAPPSAPGPPSGGTRPDRAQGPPGARRPSPASGAGEDTPDPTLRPAKPPLRPFGAGEGRQEAAALDDAPEELPGGVLAAPVVVGGVPVGVLSVLSGERPPPDRQAVLVGLAAAAGARLPSPAQPRGLSTPWWQEPLTAREQLMQQVAVGTWSWEVATDHMEVDEVSESMLHLAGIDPATWDHSSASWMERIHPDDRPGVQKALDTSLATGQPYAVEYRVIAADGSVNWVEFRAAWEYDENGRPTRLSGTAWNVTDRRSQLAWLGGLIERHPDPIHVVSQDNRVQWVNEAARRLDGGRGADIIGKVPWEHEPRLLGQGIPELLARARATPGDAVNGELTYRRSDGRLTAWNVRGVEVGGYVAVQLADITERRAAEAAEAELGHHMTELNGALIRAVGSADVTAAITDNALPMLKAEGLIVVSCEDGEARLAAAEGYSADYRAELAAAEVPPLLAELGDTTEPRFFPTPAHLETDWPRLATLARHGGRSAWAVLPLSVGSDRLGVCVISWPAPHPFSEQEKSLLGTVGVIMAQAMSKARLYEEARARAERLQEELLPGRLPPTVAVHSAARYRLAAGQEVGGDWYDTIPLPGARTLAVIGDIRGHGLEQGIAMGILRHSVLTVASLDLPVDELMAHLNDAARRLGPLTATCMLVLYDATSGECRITSAGHPPPLLLHPSGKAEEAELPSGQPLGQASVPAPVNDIFPEQDVVLVLYSDGFVAGATRDVSQLTDLMARYAGGAPMPRDPGRRDAWLETLCDTIAEQQPRDPERPDDAALLALALGRVPADRIAVWDLPWAPETAGRGRALAAERIAEWGEGDLTDTATLIVSELIGNAVRHAVGIGADVADDSAGTMRLRLLHLEDGEVVCEVYDGSQATPRVRHPLLDDEFGRGLQLVAVTAKRWGTRYTEGGKCIWATVGG
jgi:PAS domain S-box-containing protein